MPTIRTDLIGVTTVNDPDGGILILSAGDEIPEGVTVGDHLIAEADESAADAAGDEIPEGAEAKPQARRRRTTTK